MSEEKVIRLKPSRKDFEEVYFNGTQGSLFFSPTTKGKTITTIIVGIILLILLFLKDTLNKENVGILYFVSFLFLLCVVFLSVSINNIARWKKGVEAYLKSLERCSIYEIRFNNEFFKVNIDHQEENNLWKDFVTADINDDYISLDGKHSYMFPRKSMSKEEYSLLTKSIRQNIDQQ
ncbi:hypothetical protein [Chryseobacterium defluvii]|uniref:YcxB-like protein n=1 Tax=Chryseobacterium defluvii TaxID=160396 RepID=A0A495SMH5_9FLAO|nr:hypothetical protein [Chryseobacterium defluvii]RKT01481.1 hypothetical protein BCF58_0702 [Chryseobacterium defluvii]